MKAVCVTERRDLEVREVPLPAMWCGNPLFKMRIGKTFNLGQIHEAMACETAPGQKAILLTKPV